MLAEEELASPRTYRYTSYYPPKYLGPTDEEEEKPQLERKKGPNNKLDPEVVESFRSQRITVNVQNSISLLLN